KSHDLWGPARHQQYGDDSTYRSHCPTENPGSGFPMNPIPLIGVVHRPLGANTENPIGFYLALPAQDSHQRHDNGHQGQWDHEFDRWSDTDPHQSLAQLN